MTKEEREIEIVRRRNARLSIKSPGTSYCKFALTKLGAYYDKRFRQYVFPDQESLDKAQELVKLGEERWAKEHFAEVE